MKLFLAMLLLAWTCISSAEVWHFALIGDVPYLQRERKELPAMLDYIASRNVAFIAHIGDFKSGGSDCSNAVFNNRRVLFNQSRVPFVFVPGDNEWTDCNRNSNGGYDPVERLDALRKRFWNSPQTLGIKKRTVERQSTDYPEHSRFRLGPVLFVTLNLPGSHNNFGRARKGSAEFHQRNSALLAWMSDSFEQARKEKLSGIVLLFHTNPDFEHFMKGYAHPGYKPFLDKLFEETINFPGQVVAVHGDTHVNRIDHPLRHKGKLLENFTRVETFGSPMMGWTLGTIDTKAPALFQFESFPWNINKKP